MLNRLPPLNAIKAFHAVSRHLNLSRAAEELGVTQGAVSKQIIALEDFIGAKLFERSPNGLELTNEGYSLKDATLSAFDTLMTGFSRFERRPPRSQRVRLSTLASFAAEFFAPRLDRFEAAFPEVQLDILTSDRLIDHSREEIDFSIRYGGGDWEGLISQRLGSADLVAVCHPSLDVASQRLRCLHVYSADAWAAWAELPGQPRFQASSALVVEDFLVALHAALNGQGTTLLPELVVQEHIREERLIRVGSPLTNWRQQYFVAMTPRAQKRRDVMAIVDWIHAELAAAKVS